MERPKFAIYSRKSVYSGKGESVENQVEMCRAYIAEKFGPVPEAAVALYEDEGFSAKNTDRPQFRQMLRDIRDGGVVYVVCYRLDRISRNVSDFAALIEDLNRRGIHFICIKEEFDTSKPMGKAMMYIASVFAQLERETIAERVRDNMRLLARTGRWLGGSPPTGFTARRAREILLDGKVKTACHLVVHPEEIQVVKEIFQAFLEMRSVSGVSKRLIARDIRSRGGGFFSLPGLREILGNPVYCAADQDAWDFFTAQSADVCFEKSACTTRCGLLAYNKRDYRKQGIPRHDRGEWIVAIGKHPGILPGRDWVLAQRLLAETAGAGKAPAACNRYSLLSGWIRCGNCGARMFAKAHRDKERNGRFYYVCQSKLRGGKALCGIPNLPGRETDDAVGGHLAAALGRLPTVNSALRELRRDIAAGKEWDRLSELERRLRQTDVDMDALLDLALRGAGRPAEFHGRVDRRIRELSAERARLLEARRALAEDAARAPGAHLAGLAATLAGPDGLYGAMTLEERRALLELLAAGLTWDGSALHLTVYGE